MIKKFFFNLKLIGDFSVTLLDQWHVMIKLTNGKDYFRKMFYEIDQMVSFFDISKESPSFLFGFNSLIFDLNCSLIVSCKGYIHYLVIPYAFSLVPLVTLVGVLWVLVFGAFLAGYCRFASPLEFALIDKFPNYRPALNLIRKYFFNLKLSSDFLITLLDPRHVLIKLANDMDYSIVFFHNFYFVNNCFMKLIKWSPFTNIQPHLLSPCILHSFGSLFGHPLKIDNTMSNGSHPLAARVLVELDITKRYPESVSKEIRGSISFSMYMQNIEIKLTKEILYIPNNIEINGITIILPVDQYDYVKI
ncbi:hypothetical protein M5K25_017850 [Dendrobium thyrsiflorum]|uniref:DUF4283 domain-containing protein n=1 Tax=Dendrobium thyrsiflorum TaxID=117978 RepID=A0ABD0UGM5_DENTH